MGFAARALCGGCRGLGTPLEERARTALPEASIVQLCTSRQGTADCTIAVPSLHHYIAVLPLYCPPNPRHHASKLKAAADEWQVRHGHSLERVLTMGFLTGAAPIVDLYELKVWTCKIVLKYEIRVPAQCVRCEGKPPVWESCSMVHVQCRARTGVLFKACVVPAAGARIATGLSIINWGTDA